MVMHRRTIAWLLLALAFPSIITGMGCSKSEEPQEVAEADSSSTSTDVEESSLDDLHPEVTLETTAGPITLRLNGEKAPLTVRSFLDYVQSGHYEETIFHQVEADHLILGGGWTADLTEKPIRMAMLNEANNGLKNLRGTVAMFRDPAVVNSAGSQFFINLSNNSHLDHKGGAIAFSDSVGPTKPEDYGYCVFGEVVEGMDVIEKIAAAPVQSTNEFASLPVEPITIRSARRIR